MAHDENFASLILRRTPFELKSAKGAGHGFLLKHPVRKLLVSVSKICRKDTKWVGHLSRRCARLPVPRICSPSAPNNDDRKQKGWLFATLPPTTSFQPRKPAWVSRGLPVRLGDAHLILLGACLKLLAKPSALGWRFQLQRVSGEPNYHPFSPPIQLYYTNCGRVFPLQTAGLFVEYLHSNQHDARNIKTTKATC